MPENTQKMPTTCGESPPQKLSLFSSSEGQSFVRNLLRASLPFDPHDYQVEGVCACLDGKDLIALCPTGSGKTGFFSMYMLALRALAANPQLCIPARNISSHPAMVIICPTIGLEEDMAAQFARVGLTTLIINHKTIEQAHAKDEASLWVHARTEISMVIMSPEMLASKGFEGLMQHKDFARRCWGLGVDEIHLLDSWGASFRKAFWQIGHVRARMPGQTVLIGVTATLATGRPTENVLKFLRLQPGDFHLIHRSNRRPELRTIYRTLTTGLGGWKFPDFKHIWHQGKKTIMYCSTISLSFRLLTYLVSVAPRTPSPLKRVRMYNSLNSVEYNEESRRLFEEDNNLLILIATDSLMVGINLRNVVFVYLVDQPNCPEVIDQKEGRAGRDPTVVKNPTCCVYFGKKAPAVARAILDGKSLGGKNRSQRHTGQAAMDPEMARVLLAKCRTAQLDILYNNPPEDPPCTCITCSRKPPLSAMPCISSCCIPEDEDVELKKGLKRKLPNPVKKGDRLTRAMRAIGKAKMEDLRWRIFRKEDPVKTNIFPPSVFLPDAIINATLDRFALLTSNESLTTIFEDFRFAKTHQAEFFAVVVELRQTFAKMRIAAKKKPALGVEDGLEDDNEESEEDEVPESEDDMVSDDNVNVEVEGAGEAGPSQRLVIRLPPLAVIRAQVSDLKSFTPPSTPTHTRITNMIALSPSRRNVAEGQNGTEAPSTPKRPADILMHSPKKSKRSRYMVRILEVISVAY
ncbi:hypothetical protein NM688_g328 [Phlebia brevispora]|uniref:Uncharacterized protein n=1 Tax=Phlebia brevispora TaxID=194682 RepID=A0ACC1TEU6_9APHY|nr:hypothetical protein NM688_g328 [Phlebia brevispora]